ncbi:MAG: hypothetical protein RLZZ568_1762 [Cyanobacteriota bacterium]
MIDPDLVQPKLRGVLPTSPQLDILPVVNDEDSYGERRRIPTRLAKL